MSLATTGLLYQDRLLVGTVDKNMLLCQLIQYWSHSFCRKPQTPKPAVFFVSESSRTLEIACLMAVCVRFPLDALPANFRHVDRHVPAWVNFLWFPERTVITLESSWNQMVQSRNFFFFLAWFVFRWFCHFSRTTKVPEIQDNILFCLNHNIVKSRPILKLKRNQRFCKQMLFSHNYEANGASWKWPL